jgi:uncharacterized YccA/Bax inhibitor family protein
MQGSPVLTQDRFAQETREAYGSGAQVRPMTLNGTILATAALLVLLTAAAAYGWYATTQPTVVELPSGETVVQNLSWPWWLWLSMLAGLGLGLVTSFVPKIARFTAPLYALAYGTVVGAISALYDAQYDGIVSQAVVATIGVFIGMLVLYATRIIRVTNRFVMIVAGATAGIFLMYLIGWVMSLFGADLPWLTRNEFSWLGLGISVVIIIVAALNLAIDFAFVEGSVQMQAPRYLEWYAAFGITVTLVWLYLEMLRLIALLNRR